MKFIKKHEEELQDLVKNWRRSNLNIVKFWQGIHKAAINALKNREINIVGNIKIYYESDIMFIILPSGRKLSYVKPRIEKINMVVIQLLMKESVQQRNGKESKPMEQRNKNYI